MSVPVDYKHPIWNRTTPCHDWKNHIPVEIQRRWTEFNDEHQALLAEWAEEIASKEEWE